MNRPNFCFLYSQYTNCNTDKSPLAPRLPHMQHATDNSKRETPHFSFACYAWMIEQHLVKHANHDHSAIGHGTGHAVNADDAIHHKNRRNRKASDKEAGSRKQIACQAGVKTGPDQAGQQKKKPLFRGLRARLEAVASYNDRPSVHLAEHEATFISRFDGVAGVNPQGRQDIDNLASTWKTALNRLFAWTPDPDTLRDRLAVCANHGYLATVGRMLQTRAGLADFMANWPDHIETLHVLQQNGLLKPVSTIQQGRGIPTREAAEMLMDACQVDGGHDPAILKAVVDRHMAKGIPSQPSLQKIRAGCLKSRARMPVSRLACGSAHNAPSGSTNG